MTTVTPPFELGSWVTPLSSNVLFGKRRTLQAGQAYRVISWQHRSDTSYFEIELEGQPGAFVHSYFRACEPPENQLYANLIIRDGDINFEAWSKAATTVGPDDYDFSKIVDDYYQTRLAVKKLGLLPNSIVTTWNTQITGSLYPSPYISTVTKDPAMSIIPPLEVPAAPAPEPEPTLPPESASVQVLRKLLADRRDTCADAQRSKRLVEGMVAGHEAKIAELRLLIDRDEAKIAAADAAIAEALADIKKLGGRPEPTMNDKAAATATSAHTATMEALLSTAKLTKDQAAIQAALGTKKRFST